MWVIRYFISVLPVKICLGPTIITETEFLIDYCSSWGVREISMAYQQNKMTLKKPKSSELNAKLGTKPRGEI